MANLTTTGTSGYPNSIDTSTTLIDGASGDEIIAENVNGPTVAVVNVETELGTLPKGTAADVKTRLNVSQNSDGTLKSSIIPAATGTAVNYSAGVFSILPTLMRAYLTGLNISAASGSNTSTVETGLAVDSTTIDILSLGTSINKTTSTWVVGTNNGGLDTGAVAASTWYHWYLIKRTDTGVVDALFSLSAATPTMPASYSVKRRIGSRITNATGQWGPTLIQDGDYHRYVTAIADLVNSTNPGTSAVTVGLTVPTGVNVQAYLMATVRDGASQIFMYLSDLISSDIAPDSNSSSLNNTGANSGSTNTWIRTNTSGQIRYRLATSGASTVVTIQTLGWIDRRGRDG